MIFHAFLSPFSLQLMMVTLQLPPAPDASDPTNIDEQTKAIEGVIADNPDAPGPAVSQYITDQQKECTAQFVKQMQDNGAKDEDIQNFQTKIDQLQASNNQNAIWDPTFNPQVPALAASAISKFCGNLQSFAPQPVA